jgi:hypothetical protein
MIILKFSGGIGNQLFQYSFYNELEINGFNVKADITAYETYNLHEGFMLIKSYNLNLLIATKEEISKLKNSKTDLRYYFKKIFNIFKRTHIYENQLSIRKLKHNKNYYLEGYWQSYELFKNSIELTKNKLKLDSNKLCIENLNNLKLIETRNSVSVHFRKGDYIYNKDVYELYGNICTHKYYKMSVSYIIENVIDPVFFVFSDDIEWVKKQELFSGNFYFINNNNIKNNHIDIFLMSKCKHNIIANSSFSWWGAFLNKNEKKIVIAPKIWKSKNDIYSINQRIPEEWIKMEV